jgi:hypothetical protein
VSIVKGDCEALDRLRPGWEDLSLQFRDTHTTSALSAELGFGLCVEFCELREFVFMVQNVMLDIDIETGLAIVAEGELDQGARLHCLDPRALADMKNGWHFSTTPSDDFRFAGRELPDTTTN